MMLARGNFKNRKRPFSLLKRWKKPKIKALIIRSGALGDTLMLLPGLAQLADRAQIHVVGRNPGIEFLKPYVSGCLDFEGPEWHRLFSDPPQKTERPAWPMVDLVIAYSAASSTVLKQNLDFYFPQAKVCIFPPLPTDQDQHVALYLAQGLAMAGLDLDPQKALQEAFERPLLNHAGPTPVARDLVLHPGSGSLKKNLEPRFWPALMQALRERFRPEQTFILLGPAEEALHEYFRRQTSATRLVFAPGRQELMQLLNRAALYVGHDSGITHLAALLGRPVIALFKNSSVVQWHPLGPAVTVIEAHEPLDAVMARTLGAVRSFLREGSKTEKNFQPQT